MSLAARVTASQLLAEATYRLIARALTARGIDHLLLKGPHLGALVYESQWEREYGDLDVLVRERQFAEALAALLDNGFSRQSGPAGRDATVASFYNRGLLSPHGWLVEVHRAFSGYALFDVDYEALFTRAVSFRFGQVDARGLALEDLLLHLVIHAAKSHFRGIEAKHVQDVGLLVDRQRVYWDTFLSRSREAGCQTASWVLLSAAAKVHGADVPGEVLRRIEPRSLRRLWLDLWLTRERFPLFRHPRLPLWMGRLVVAPAITDSVWHGAISGLRFATVRFRDLIGRARV